MESKAFILLRLAKLEELFLQQSKAQSRMEWETTIPNTELTLVAVYIRDIKGTLSHALILKDCYYERKRQQYQLTFQSMCDLFLDWYETYSELPEDHNNPPM